MHIPEIRLADDGLLDQIAGLMGVGWTASVLGFLSTVVGLGNGVVARVVADPQSLLYVGAVFFLATLGLDRLTDSANREQQT